MNNIYKAYERFLEQRHLEVVEAAAPELLKACEDMVQWFDALQKKQAALLITGQTFDSACENWDKATENTGFDLTQMRAAIEKARGNAK